MKAVYALLLFVSTSLGVQATDRSGQEDGIRDATFRFEIQRLSVHPPKVYFLRVYDVSLHKDVDPSDAFMKRFAANEPRVAKASESTSFSGGTVRDKITGDEGILLTLKPIKWLTGDEVELTGIDEGDGSGETNYLLKKKDGKWAVVKSGPMLIVY